MWTQEHRDKSIKLKKEQALKKHLERNNYKHTSNHLLKKILITSGKKYECEECNLSEWRDNVLSLELDHIDGNSFNNDLNNLRFLCPNCHSITENFRGKNKNSGRKKVSDDNLLQALKETNNIRQALIQVGLSPRGGNYTRASKLLMGAWRNR